MSSPEWMARSACGPEDDMLFYPPEGLPQTEKDLLRARALRVCADCPVQDQCYNFAITNGERFGVWGGQALRTPTLVECGTESGAQLHRQRGERPCASCREARRLARRARDRAARQEKRLPPVKGHGTLTAYRAHYKRGEVACRSCKDAYNDWRRVRDAHRRATTSTGAVAS